MATHPAWIKVRVPTPTQAQGMAEMRSLLERHRLRTVCQGAQCPNAPECWSARTATFLLLGDTCTRACRFCDVPTGNPRGRIDPNEPDRLARAVRELGLTYVVLTSVDRDDLPDGGADAFARAVEGLTDGFDPVTVEVLLPDFRGVRASLDRILSTKAGVLGHNLETVRRLSAELRDRRAGYEQSLEVLAYLRKHSGGRRIKSGLMAGLGESTAELRGAMSDLRHVGVDVITIGQYLQPQITAAPVARYLHPREFEQLEMYARHLGFDSVAAGPMVRSSYHAALLT